MKFYIFVLIVAVSGWEYPESIGHWDEFCHNQQRGSPIDFRYTYEKNSYANLGTFRFSPGYGKLATWDATDNGHSMVFSNPKNRNGTEVEAFVEGGGLNYKYKFHSFHFHWGNQRLKGGSEHTVNGKHYFSEVHMIHYREDCADLSDCFKYSDGLAVFGFFLEIVDDDRNRDNLFLHKMVSAVQRKHFKIGQSIPNFVEFKLNSFLPSPVELEVFYRYDGSLTTPGCNEIIVWTVFKKPIPISPHLARVFTRMIRLEHEEGKKVHGLYTNRKFLEHNFREAQDLNYRTVTVSSPNPGLMHLILSHEYILQKLEQKIDSKDNFSNLIANAIRPH